MRDRIFSIALGLVVAAGAGLAGGCYGSWRGDDPQTLERQRMVYPSDPPLRGQFLAVRPDEVIAEPLAEEPPPRLMQPPPLTVRARPIIPPRGAAGEVIQAPPQEPPGQPITPPTTQPD